MIEHKIDYETMMLQAMNTTIEMTVETPNRRADWKQKMAQLVSYIQHEWSRFEENNSLSAFNRALKERRITVTPLLYDILTSAQHYADVTDYYFNPFLLSNIKQAGYKQSFPFKKTDDTSSFSKQLDPTAARLSFNEKTLSVVKHTDHHVDLGGIAKGWLAEYVKSWLQQEAGCPSGMINIGGDLTVWSDKNEPWAIRVAHPFNEAESIGIIKIKHGALATSNTIYRRWTKEGKEFHHILNGRTGTCANSNIVQATVKCNSAVEAEVIAKVLCILGEEDGIKWVNERFPSTNFLLVRSDGTIVSNFNK